MSVSASTLSLVAASNRAARDFAVSICRRDIYESRITGRGSLLRRDDRDEITGYRFKIAAADTSDNMEFHVLTPLYVKGDKRPAGTVAEGRFRR